MEDKSIVQNDKVGVKGRQISKLATWTTAGAATGLFVAHYIPLDLVDGYEIPVVLPFWLTSVTALVGFLLSAAKIFTSRTWKSRLIGLLFILINLTVIAMSAFSIALSFVNVLGG